MLENLSRDPPRKSAPVTEDIVIPDPWELTSSTSRPNTKSAFITPFEPKRLKVVALQPKSGSAD